MDKLILTPEVIEALNFMTQAAQIFVGYPAWIKHAEMIKNNIQKDPDSVSKEG